MDSYKKALQVVPELCLPKSTLFPSQIHLTALPQSFPLHPCNASATIDSAIDDDKANSQSPARHPKTTDLAKGKESAHRHRGRLEPPHLTPHQGQNYHQPQLREESSTSRGRTRRRSDEYVCPPRDPTRQISSSPDEPLYPDGRGNFIPRSVLTGQAPLPGPGSYFSRMANEHHHHHSHHNGESARQRSYREQAAAMELQNRVSQQRTPEHTLRRAQTHDVQHHQQNSTRNNRRSKAKRRSKGSRSNGGCCVIL